MFLNGFCQGGHVGTDYRRNLLFILEQYDCRHCGHAQMFGDIRGLVHIHLVESSLGVTLRQFDQHGGYHFARTTPDGEAVEDNEGFSGILELSLEFRQALKRK
jgi:hypothetical protein